jgi:hypothetical protein
MSTKVMRAGMTCFDFGDLGQLVEPRVGHRDLAHIGLDRAEGEVRRLRRRRPRQRVEQRGFAHVRQTDDPDLEAHGAFPLRNSPRHKG